MAAFHPHRVFESLYGGEKPTPHQVRRSLAKAGLTLPVHIISIELEHHHPQDLTFTAPPLNAWVIDSNRGMLYIVYNGPREDMERLCDQQSLVHGHSHLCSTSEQWMDILRRSVHSARQNYLSLLSTINPQKLTPAYEMECRSLALKTFQHDTHWRKSLEHWLDIALIQNQNYLYELRRKCVEFISAITSGVDKSDPLSFLYIQALQEILQSYGFSDFHTIIPRIMTNLRPHVILDTTNVLSESTHSEPLKRALSIIRKLYTTPICVSEISGLCFVSREHLARLFQEEIGYTITEFLQLLRVGHAKQLLTETDEGILEIALDSGFNTVEHFHRTFKKHTHTTPHRYRKTN